MDKRCHSFVKSSDGGEKLWEALPKSISSFPATSSTILNERMQGLPNGEGCSLRGVIPLRRPDKEGCNWMPGVITNACRAALQEVVGRARLEFDIVD
jgi:hypothetical protein